MKLSRKKIGLVIVGLIVVCAGMSVWLLRPAPPQPQPQPPQDPNVVRQSTAQPDEQKPPTTYVWSGSPNDPKRITLPIINAQGFVQKVDVDQHQQMAVPNNIHMAGWFVKSQAPGSKGLSIINGHVDGHSLPGIFSELAKMGIGNQFTVEMGDGRVLNYAVKRVQTVPTAQAADALYSQDPGIARQLNLITCGGNFTESAGYDQRIIVVAEQL